MSPAMEEPECRICYDRFDLRSRRPKRLLCGHCACARCLRRMAESAESENALEALGSPVRLSCPFCRQETPVPQREVGRLPDDATVLPLLKGPSQAPEVLLCPGGVLETLPGGPLGSPSSSSPSSSSSDCLVVTLLELPLEGPLEGSLGLLEVMRLHRPPSLGSLPCYLPLAGKCRPCLGGPPSGASCGPRDLPRFLLGALCLAYLSSLPFGIYLLLEGHLNLGIVLVSLVPSTLILCLCYSLGQCLCQEAFPAGPSSAASS